METKTFPGDGIAHLIIDRVARDARLQGGSDVAIVQVTYQPVSGEEPAEFVVEGEALYFRSATAQRVAFPRHIAVTVNETMGELRVQDVDGPVSLDTVRGDLRLKDLASRVQVGQVDGSLRADNVADLRIREGCAGDLRLQSGGPLSVETVGGDVRLYQSGPARLAHVRGDLWAEKLAGPLQVDWTDGDVRLSYIEGRVSLKGVAGDVHTAELSGGLTASGIRGDADLRGPYSAEHEYSLTTAGDLSAYLPVGADIRLSVRAGGRVRSDIQLTPAPDGSTTFTANLGRGAGRLALIAAGDVRIVQAERVEASRPQSATLATGRPDPPEGLGDVRGWQELGERIQQQVTASLAAAGIDLENGPSGFGGSLIAPDMPQAAQRARAAAANRAGTTEQPRSPSAASAGPSEAELMVILKMIEAGTINAAEAEVLIRALGGQ